MRLTSFTTRTFLAVALATTAAAQNPTPTLNSLESLGNATGPGAILASRGFIGEEIVGLAAACLKPETAIVRVSLGSFPLTPQPLQLAIRTAEGRVERFGPVFTADRSSGTHSPDVEDGDVDRFLEAIQLPGTLVSNGYSSFFVQLSSRDHARIRELIRTC